MIIACPACRTRYVVPDTAIGVDGRTVRCAKCKHSWFQDGPETVAAAREVPVPPPSQEPKTEFPPSTGTVDEPSMPSAEGPVEKEAVSPGTPPPQPSVNYWRTPETPREADAANIGSERDGLRSPLDDSDLDNPVSPPPVEETERQARPDAEETDTGYEGDSSYSQFDYEPPFRSRRNPLKLWTAAALLFAVSAIAAIAAVNIWGMPSWLPFERPVFGLERPGLTLDFPPEEQDLRTLPNGAEYLEVKGSVANTGRETLSVPTITIALRNEQDQIVYTWEIVPPQSELAPGETMSISEAMVDVPRSARVIEIGWTP